jgi:two-component system, OmpR family, aerobic respiration control sensor histidine kinase ArcB
MVTRQKNREIEQFCSGLDLHQLIDCIPGFTYIKDLEGVFYECHLDDVDFSVKGAELVGKTDYDVLSKEEADQLRENDQKVMKSKKKMVFIEKVTGKSGKTITACSIKAPLIDKNGKVIGIIGHTTKIDSVRDQI